MVMSIPEEELTPLLVMRRHSLLHPIVSSMFALMGMQSGQSVDAFKTAVEQYDASSMTSDDYKRMKGLGTDHEEDPVISPFMAWSQ